MFKYIIQLLRALNANAKPSQIAHAFSIGLILGFVPKNNLLWYMLLVFFLFVRISKGGYFIMMILGALLAPLADPLFDKVGYAVLTFKPLESFYAWLIDIPFVGFTKFNNTVVCGSLVCGILMYVPLFFLMMLFVKYWRKIVAPLFNNSRLAKAFYKLPMVEKIASKAAEIM